MPVFNYKALKEGGGAEAGLIDADSPKDARLKLRSRNLHVTVLVPVKGKGEKRGRLGLPRFRRANVHAVSVMTRQLGTLLHSGIPLMGSLTAVIEQAEDHGLKALLMSVREKVAQGATLSDSLAEHPSAFDELYVNMVKAGEASGALDKVLYRIADYLHMQNRVRQKIIAALTYPMIMAVIGVGVVFVLLTFVVPRILDVLQRHGKAALPLPTEILLMVSSFFSGYWWALGAGLAVAWVMFRSWKATKAGRLRWDTIKLEFPLVGPLLRRAAISRFCVTFATLLESGLSVLESLQVVKRVVNNELLANAIETIRQKITEGADIATPMKQSRVFPPVVGYMIAVGEESGRLEDLLKRIAEAYDEEIEIAAQKLTSMLEPIMIVVMAVVVGFVVLSILLPIFQMSNI